MLYVIHGDDVVLSQQKLDEFIKSHDWVVRIDGKKASAADLQNAFKSEGLFANKKLIIIENIFNITSPDLSQILPLLASATSQNNFDLVIIEGKIVDAKILNQLKKAQIFKYALPRYLYTFLDDIAPKNGRQLLEVMFKLQKNITSEQIFYALLRRIRLLLMLKSSKPVSLDEIKTMQDWQLARLKKQTSLWQERQLMNFYRKLFDLEIKLKTSQLPMSLSKHIEILLITKL